VARTADGIQKLGQPMRRALYAALLLHFIAGELAEQAGVETAGFWDDAVKTVDRALKKASRAVKSVAKLGRDAIFDLVQGIIPAPAGKLVVDLMRTLLGAGSAVALGGLKAVLGMLRSFAEGKPLDALKGLLVYANLLVLDTPALGALAKAMGVSATRLRRAMKRTARTQPFLALQIIGLITSALSPQAAASQLLGVVRPVAGIFVEELGPKGSARATARGVDAALLAVQLIVVGVGSLTEVADIVAAKAKTSPEAIRAELKRAVNALGKLDLGTFFRALMALAQTPGMERFERALSEPSPVLDPEGAIEAEARKIQAEVQRRLAAQESARSAPPAFGMDWSMQLAS
jgi:hypothetical protein